MIVMDGLSWIPAVKTPTARILRAVSMMGSCCPARGGHLWLI